MNAKELLILNFEEVRRRSIEVWKNISEENLFWKPNSGTMCSIEMIRHVLELENIYHQIITHRGTIGNYESILTGNPYTSIEDELKNAQPYREKFLKMVHSFSSKELEEVDIFRRDKKQYCKLGDYLLRIVYQEGVHTGQLLDYLHTLKAPRTFN